jgi:hypothetical protein
LNAYSSLAQVIAPDDIAPTVTSVKPLPRTLDRTPTITATVSDDRDELSASSIKLALDGKAKSTISYDANMNRLAYNSGWLSVGKHTVRITGTDATSNDTTRTWTFKVVRR